MVVNLFVIKKWKKKYGYQKRVGRAEKREKPWRKEVGINEKKLMWRNNRKVKEIMEQEVMKIY